MNEIPNSESATKPKTCNATGADFIYGACTTSGCLAGFNLQGNSCIANKCTSNQGLGTVSCIDEIPFSASATKTETCNATGADYVYGACSVSGCLAGYYLQNNSCVPNVCTPNESLGTVSCTGEISYSAIAAKSKTCDEIGSGYLFGSCAATGCLTGYNLQNNSCIPNACNPSESYGSVSCTEEISYSADATKSQTCNATGSSFVYGACSVSGCLPDYHLSGNSCVANTCVPNKDYGLVSCTEEISYSVNATKPKSCNATGADYVYGACATSGCLAGFYLENNSCLPNACTPNQDLGTVSCVNEIPNSESATKPKTCNAVGSNYLFGTCTTSGCLAGFNLQGNSCVANKCTPDQGLGTVSCVNEIPNSESATKPKTCNATGADYIYGSCTTSGCLAGYNLQNNSCVPNACSPGQSLGTVSCTEEISYSASASKTKTCNATGSGDIYGACSVSGCLAGYNLQNNSCVANACTPNQSLGTVSCTNESAFSATATKTKACNATGSDYTYGTCSTSGCLTGYNLQSNSCVANACTPNQSLAAVSCINEIAFSATATKPMACNDVGSGYTYGSCSVSGCLTGYNLQSNSCVANTCTPNQILAPVSCINEILDSATATKSKTCNAAGSDYVFGSCAVSSCVAGFVVTNNTCQGVSVSIADASTLEGNSGTKSLTFTVTLSSALPTTVSVNYATADGTAKSTGGSTDFTAASNTLTFSAGTTTRTISVSIKGDTNKEPDETFYVNLTGPTGGLVISRAQAVGTIRNDD